MTQENPRRLTLGGLPPPAMEFMDTLVIDLMIVSHCLHTSDSSPPKKEA